MKPTIGRIVLYVTNAADAVAINTARQQLFAHPAPGSDASPTNGFIRQGNNVEEGDIFPADVVNVFGDSENPPVNLQVKLDGNDQYWATSRHVDDAKTPGTWHWMEHQKQQAAKESAEPVTGVGGTAGTAMGAAEGIGALPDPVVSETPPSPTAEEAAAQEEADRKLKEEVGF